MNKDSREWEGRGRGRGGNLEKGESWGDDVKVFSLFEEIFEILRVIAHEITRLEEIDDVLCRDNKNISEFTEGLEATPHLGALTMIRSALILFQIPHQLDPTESKRDLHALHAIEEDSEPLISLLLLLPLFALLMCSRERERERERESSREREANP